MVGLWVVQKVLSCGFVVLDGFGIPSNTGRSGMVCLQVQEKKV